MPYDDKRRLQTPDFYPDQPIDWMDMGESQQVNIQPAVGAFKQRFMGNMGEGNPPNPGMNDLPEIDAQIPDNVAGGAPMKKGGMKSL